MDIGGEPLTDALRGVVDERRKELSVLHPVAQWLLGGDTGSLDGLALLIPSAFRIPDFTRARIRIGDACFGCREFPKDVPILAATFKAPDETEGLLEVARLPGPEQRLQFEAEEEVVLQGLVQFLEFLFRPADAGRRLEETERRFRALFDNDQDCVKVLDAERRLVAMNPAGLRMLERHDVGELAGARLEPFIHPDDVAEYRRLHAAALQGNTARGRYRLIGPDGSARFLETVNMPVPAANGERQVLSITNDLTRLVREEDKFRHLLDSSHDSMIVVDGRGVIRIVNRACETTFGYTRYELIGQPVEILLPQALRENHVRQRVAYTKKPHVRSMGQPLQGRRKNGNEFPADVSLVPVHGDGERLICATVRDLAGVREFEIALQEMADQVAVHTGQDYFNEMVKYLSSHFGLHIAVIGMLDEEEQRICTLAVGQDGELDNNMIYPLLGSPCAHVVRNRPRFHAEGIQAQYPEDRWFRNVDAQGYAGVPIYDPDGKIIGLISAISTRKLPNIAGVESFFKLAASRAGAELDRMRQTAAIEESERRYTLVESGIADGIWDINLLTNTVYYSPRVSELLGLAPAELGDNIEVFLARLHPDDILPAREARHEHVQRGTPFDIEYRVRHADGTYRWFRTHGRVLRDTAGQPMRFSGNFTDITDAKRHQQQLKAENAWLAAFARSPSLSELLDVIAGTAKDLFDDAAANVWMLAADGSLQVFPTETASGLEPSALRAISSGTETSLVLTPASANWPWRKGDRAFGRVVVHSVMVEGVPERVAIAVSYARHLPQQRHEHHFLLAAERLVRLALEQLRQKAELERQRLLFKNLFECAPDAMVILDRDDCVRAVNPRFTQLFHFTAQDAHGKPLNDLIVPAAFAHEAETLSNGAMRGNTVARDSFRCRKDGVLVPVAILGAPVTVTGIDASYFAVYRDQSSLHEAAQRLDFQARHDQLTGLPNRYEFERRLQQAMALSAEGQGYTGVLYFDLDQFKVINDTAGHARGDDVLKEVTRRLRPLVPAPHLLARLGGDEFAVLLVNGRLKDCENLAQQIRDGLSGAPFPLGDRLFPVTASFGVVAIEAGTRQDPHEVLSLADSACFLAKERGRNRIQVYDPSDVDVAQRREEMDWISRINEALVEERFQLQYQRIEPVSGDSALAHVEILLRMIDRDGSTVLPSVFIPPAERYNLMPRIDRWVLESVFRRLGERGREAQENLLVAVNISGSTLSDESLPEFVVNLFEQHAVLPRSLCFEITETAAIGNFEDALQFIAVLRMLGCRVALDDFGSGLSSFRYLKEIAPDYLKIDGSFVREIGRSSTDYSMVEAINRVGKIIGIHTIAEFVEDETILDALREIGVDYAQGYHLHQPEPWSS